MTYRRAFKRFGLSCATLLVAATMLPGIASAAQITGEISFDGAGNSYIPDNGDLSGATSLSFPVDIAVDGTTGDMTTLAGATADFSDFAFNPPSAPGTLIFSSGDLQFTADSIVVIFVTANALNLSLAGTYEGLNFDATPGTMSMSFDALGGLFTYSATGSTQPAAIPVPGALLLLGSALFGTGLMRRRKA